MTKRIYLNDDSGETCMVGLDLIPDLEPGKWGLECDEDATYDIRDTVTGITWEVCEKHKEEAKAKGIAY